MSISEKLIELIRNRPINAKDLDQAALYLLDALACAYAGTRTPVGKKLAAWARQDTQSTRSIVFLLGALTHITETDDLHR